MSSGPPSVDYPSDSRTGPAVAQAMGATLWLLMLALWCWHATDGLGATPPAAWWFALALGLALLGHGVLSIRTGPAGLLRWQAPVPAGAHDPDQPDAAPRPVPGQWIWVSAAYRRGTPLTDIDWALDLQRAVLLRLRTRAGLSMWVWLRRASQPADWDALRRALTAARATRAD